MIAEATAGTIMLKAASYIFAGCCLAIGFRMGNSLVNRTAALAASKNPRVIKEAEDSYEKIIEAIHATNKEEVE